jgi:hypothetical protein
MLLSFKDHQDSYDKDVFLVWFLEVLIWVRSNDPGRLELCEQEQLELLHAIMRR